MQISLTGGIPFPISLPKAPASINMDAMTADELHSALQAGYDDMQAGKVKDASAAFAAFRESRKWNDTMSPESILDAEDYLNSAFYPMIAKAQKYDS